MHIYPELRRKKKKILKEQINVKERMQKTLSDVVYLFVLVRLHSAGGHIGLMRNKAVYTKQVITTKTWQVKTWPLSHQCTSGLVSMDSLCVCVCMCVCVCVCVVCRPGQTEWDRRTMLSHQSVQNTTWHGWLVHHILMIWLFCILARSTSYKMASVKVAQELHTLET